MNQDSLDWSFISDIWYSEWKKGVVDKQKHIKTPPNKTCYFSQASKLLLNRTKTWAAKGNHWYNVVWIVNLPLWIFSGKLYENLLVHTYLKNYSFRKHECNLHICSTTLEVWHSLFLLPARQFKLPWSQKISVSVFIEDGERLVLFSFDWQKIIRAGLMGALLNRNFCHLWWWYRQEF